MRHAYREDLSWIHDLGFGDLAQDAADRLLQMLAAEGIDSGLVVDLGCGSGILSEAVFRAGYDVLGIDLSPVMIEMARSRLPQGGFRCESLLTADIPSCVAVAAVGELFRRDDECHELELLPEEELPADLVAAGFTTKVLDAYSERPMPPGLRGFVARRLRTT